MLKLDPADPDKKIGPYQADLLAKTIIANTKQLGTLSNNLRTHIFDIIHNTLSTRTRTRWRQHTTSCPLCNNDDETLSHLHTTCLATARAKQLILAAVPDRAAHDILVSADADRFTFRNNPDQPQDRQESERLLLFSHCLWRTRIRFFDKDFLPTFIEASARQISQSYLHHIYLKNQRLQEARRQKEEKKRAFLATLEAVQRDPSCLCIFTDGSSYGNPGPAGSGVYGYAPALPNSRAIYRSLSWCRYKQPS